MTRTPVEAHFIPGPTGRLFTLLRRRPGSKRCAIFVPPFGEEMNRCRRLAAKAAEDLLAVGYSVIMPDLSGTGDSEGEFEDASWVGWQDDLSRVAEWASRQGLRPDALIATRLGCALAADCLRAGRLSVPMAVFWQPVDNGETYLKQFLRLRVAAAMARDQRVTVAGLLAQLEGGESIEVAGYALSPRLAGEIRRIDGDCYRGLPLEALAIVQVNRAAQSPAHSPASLVARAAEGSGVKVDVIELTGEPYWATAEIADNAKLRECTVDWLSGADVER